jgi:hypothetical protein
MKGFTERTTSFGHGLKPFRGTESGGGKPKCTAVSNHGAFGQYEMSTRNLGKAS